MIAYLALLPCVVAAVAVLILRRNVLTASILAFATAATIWALGVFAPATIGQLGRAGMDTSILELLVGLVIFPGILFVEGTNRGGSQRALVRAIETLNLEPARKVILIAVGIGVMMESLTGYGVSMFVTVPLLLKEVSRGRAIYLALIGMSLMSWGALSITALLGAELAGLAAHVLASEMLFTSGPIAAVLPLFCLVFMPNVTIKNAIYALVSGVVLVSGIAVSSHYVGVEIAGVGGGLAVIVFVILSSDGARSFVKSITTPEIRPYGLLIIMVVLQKAVFPIFSDAGITLVVETERVSFHVLNSPGIPLFLVFIYCFLSFPPEKRFARGYVVFKHAVTRSWPALTSIFAFLMTARLLVEIESIQSLANLVSTYGLYSAAVFTAVLGAIGSYVTGSGTASTALFMVSAVATGDSLNAIPLFASLQLSAGAHAGVASLPIIAILLAALPNEEVNDKSTAVRIGLILGTIWLLFVIFSGVAQIAITH